MRSFIRKKGSRKAGWSIMVAVSAALIILGGLVGPARAQVDDDEEDKSDAKADVTGDGTVNILDLSTMGSRFGLQAGQAGYRGGLDLDANGSIGMSDFMEVLSRFGTTGAPTTPTMFQGTVFDGLGNRLRGVTVQLGDTVEGCTDRNGAYALPLESSDFGENLVTFAGPTFDPVGGEASESCDLNAVDPTPGFLSGQYPTIPNKPVYINAGIDNVFRAVPLPERDLTGSVDLREVGTNIGGTTWLVNNYKKFKNAGVKLGVPEGCTATFPAGEDPVLSITRVPPDRLPVPMPPGLSSSLFVTYQPGSTEISCPDGTELITEFDNDDGFPVGMGNLTDGPFLAGITNGVFTPLVACEVLVGGATVRCLITPPFDFAWYHIDIRPPDPCERTTVIGQVIDVSNSGSAVVGASVSVPGAVPVLTDALGQFSIPNVPAGPNGPGCFNNPFSIRAAASDDLNGDGTLQSEEFGVSKLALAVSGGLTDVMDIRLGLEGGAVQGRVLKLSSVDPFVVTPLPGAFIDLFPSAGVVQNRTTDGSGNYSFPDVARGLYDLNAEFSGELPVPGGGTEFKDLFDDQSGDIDFAGKVEVKDFRFTGTGSVQVTVVDEFGNPVPFVAVELVAFGGNLGGGFVAPAANCTDFTGQNGVATLSAENFSCFSSEADVFGVPLGPCEVHVGGFNNDNRNNDNGIGTVGPGDGCFVNQHGELLTLNVVAQRPGDIDNVVIFQGESEGVDQIFVDVEYSKPFSLEECFDIFFKLEFDTDQNPATGADSLISDIAPDPTGLGVELILECDPFCTLTRADGTVVYADTSSFGCINRPEGDFTTVSIGIRKDEFVNAAGGPGTYDMALLSRFGGEENQNSLVELGFGTFDVVPNGGSVPVNSEDSGQVFDDELGDTFGGIFFPPF